MATSIIIFIISIVIGVLGSMLGIGGGVFLIPMLTGIVGLPIKTAIGARDRYDHGRTGRRIHGSAAQPAHPGRDICSGAALRGIQYGGWFPP